ncbi:MAG: Quinoprotein glucose dehydrogenase [Phenylobacterium sp.]|jgi:quinoprotein glucose dehydrogenase|nr:Quinoprotein glucose dehydrogenase [Phenylobacterium sp.]
MNRRGFFASVAALATAWAGPGAAAGREVEWRYYAGDQGGSKYSALDQIDARNVSKLGVAWRWTQFDQPSAEFKSQPTLFESVPLVIDGLLFTSTAYANVAALDAVSGKELWRFETGANKLGELVVASGYKHRGLAAWRDAGKLRIFVASRSGLYSLDARTGQPTPGFGTGGRVALDDGTSLAKALANPTYEYRSSPPLIVGDIVIVGGSIFDHESLDKPNVGAVQAFDARTGKPLWVFQTIPQSADAAGAETWENGSWAGTGHANVWAPMSADEARGLIYLPVSTPTNDFYGGGRPGAGLFGESLVCLEAATGKLRWRFQFVHHGVWDYDTPAQPNLLTIKVGGRRIDAVAQVTKQGFTYVFDRVTGEPVWPIVERPVPTDTDIPGERLSPTQPFPSRPPPFVPQGVTLEDANDLTPQIKALAQAQLQTFRMGPVFTPQSLGGSLQRPSNVGGGNWSGASVDPESGYLYVRGTNTISVTAVGANTGGDKYVSAPWHAAFGRPRSTTLPGGLPLIKPPYSTITAYDLNTGDIAWQVPIGEGATAIRKHPLLKGVALPARLGSAINGGGVLVTRTLLFAGGGDGWFYAFDKKTGAEVWRTPLPFKNASNPMTFRTRDGAQVIVIANGAGVDAGLVAFRLGAPPLPEDPKPAGRT